MWSGTRCALAQLKIKNPERHARAGASLAQSREIALGKVAFARSKMSVNSAQLAFASFIFRFRRRKKTRINIVVLRIFKPCFTKSHRSSLILSIRGHL